MALAIHKRIVVNQDGSKPAFSTLFGFFINMRDKVTNAKLGGGEQQIPGYYMGTRSDARKVAAHEQVVYSEQYPEATITVESHGMEAIGPLMASRMAELLEAQRFEMLTSSYLSQCIAEREAEHSLEIKPELTMEARVQHVLDNAHGFVRHQIEGIRAKQAADASGILDNEGNPIASGVKQTVVHAELDEEEQSELDALIAEQRIHAGFGQVLQFPGGEPVDSADACSQEDTPVSA